MHPATCSTIDPGLEIVKICICAFLNDNDEVKQ